MLKSEKRIKTMANYVMGFAKRVAFDGTVDGKRPAVKMNETPLLRGKLSHGAGSGVVTSEASVKSRMPACTIIIVSRR